MQKKRIQVVDTLRGFALFMIVSIHYVEHFDFFKEPEIHFFFTKQFDKQVIEWMYLLIAGKAYSIFAILFGFSFYLQVDEKKSKGIDLRKKFAWRMALLLLIGFIHSLFYQGDILLTYALASFPLLFLTTLNTRVLWVIASLLIIQIPFIYQVIMFDIEPDYKVFSPLKAYWEQGNKVFANGSFFDVVSYNVWKGRSSVWSWFYGNGRYLQIIALFIVGILLGRNNSLKFTETKIKTYIKILFISILGTLILYYVNTKLIKEVGLLKPQVRIVGKLLKSLINIGVTSCTFTTVVILYSYFRCNRIFNYLAAYGKMSLTNYVSQSLFGVIFFYGYGFSMYKYFGTGWSLILGLSIFTVQAIISNWWNQKFCYGPLEWLWRCGTERSFAVQFKRNE